MFFTLLLISVILIIVGIWLIKWWHFDIRGLNEIDNPSLGFLANIEYYLPYFLSALCLLVGSYILIKLIKRRKSY